MTDEERRRTMEFIVEQQAQFAANIQQHDENLRKLEEERIQDRPRVAGLEQSFKTLVKLAEIHDIRIDAVESSTAALDGRTSGLEDAVQQLDRLMKKSQARLDKLESRS
jgi:vacuolar-type H+-ATPase subunit I/STV1